MLLDPNVERYIQRQLRPLKAEIKKLKAEVEALHPRVKKTAVLNQDV